MVELSVVVATLKPRDEVEVIRYLDACTFDDYEVILRDDFPVTKARNEGYKRAEAEKILFLDDDSMPRPEYLTEAAATLDEHAVAVGRTVHPRDDAFAGQLTAHYDFGPEPRSVTRFWGCNVGMRKEALETVGGWDEQMGWGHEEKELAERLLAHYDFRYNPRMVVDHVYVESMAEYWKKAYKLELWTPYYWGKQGLDRKEMWRRIAREALDPVQYGGRSLTLTTARIGRGVMGAIGRAVGMYRHPYSPSDSETEATDESAATLRS